MKILRVNYLFHDFLIKLQQSISELSQYKQRWMHSFCFSDSRCKLNLSWQRPLSYRNQSICSANQWTGFYMITASVVKELMKWVGIFQMKNFWLGIFRGRVWLVGIFRVGIFTEGIFLETQYSSVQYSSVLLKKQVIS